MNEEQRAEAKEAFSLFDDGNGIPMPQLTTALRSLGSELTESECMELARQAGARGNVNFQTFASLVAKSQDDATSEEEILQAFQVFDENGDGCISIGSLRNILTMLGAEKMSSVEFEQLTQKAKLG